MRLEARHQSSGLNTRFNGGQLPFADYVARSREMIALARSGTAAANPEEIVAGNAPFALKPAAGYPPGQEHTYQRGVLLTHGLTDSPYFMRYLAEFFRENGFRVMAVLLPGHGTQPGDLLDVTWQEWAKTVAYGTDRVAEEADEVYLAGFSAGGTLSVFQSLHDDRVRGLFLFSPAFRITPRAALAGLHKLYSWMMPPAKWVGIGPDKSLYKYESLPKNAAAQMYALTKKLRSLLREREVSIPVFAAASQDDTTVNTPATLEFMAHARHSSSRLVLYTTDTGKLPPGIPEEKVELVNSVIPDQKILSSAHTAIVLPPDDAHYGAAGDYSNSIHYYPGDMEKYDACNNNHKEVLLGEITGANLKSGTLRRLMYNPNFAALKISMKRFMDNLP
ncbi:MAG: alpha/beta fold hydrolase [Nitrosomonadales bacterium]|nr:alpha/beta fold hydrolase [Nitrosomonadales bacterium]